MKTKPAPSPYPQIIGIPGGGLSHATWAKNDDVAKIGQASEVKTAKVLDRLAVPGGPTVMHDLMLPMASITANIDHLIVSGHNVYLIDSKVWKPGRIWTFGGKTRRGCCGLFPSGDKRTMEMAQLSITGYLRNKHVLVRISRPLLVVWSSRREDAPNIRWYRPIGASAISEEKLDRRITRMFGTKLGSPEVIAALMPLVVSIQAAKGPGGRRRASPVVAQNRSATFWSRFACDAGTVRDVGVAVEAPVHLAAVLAARVELPVVAAVALLAHHNEFVAETIASRADQPKWLSDVASRIAGPMHADTRRVANVERMRRVRSRRYDAAA